MKKMKTFARIFELPEVGSQLLITVDYNDVEERYQLWVRTQLDGVDIRVGVSGKFLTEDLARKKLMAYTRSEAIFLHLNLARNYRSHKNS